MSQLTVRPLQAAQGGRAVAALAVLAALALLFAVAFDQGQLAGLVHAAAQDSTVHEFFHDTRHLLGFPCH